MPGTKSLSGSESLPEAQDLMLHTPPSKQMAARSAAAPSFFHSCLLSSVLVS